MESSQVPQQKMKTPTKIPSWTPGEKKKFQANLKHFVLTPQPSPGVSAGNQP